ncbi:MAG: peptidase [Pseudomonadota bacterium]
MTYCVALKLDEGLVFLSDTRTNAGVDDVSRYKKMFTWEIPGERAVVMMTAGNLSITQGVITRLNVAIEESAPEAPTETILTAPDLFRIAQITGRVMRDLVGKHGDAIEKEGASSGASIILGGQIDGQPPRLFLIYSAGNFIECVEDTPFLQIGEIKYGKPILDRTITRDTSLDEGIRTALVSMDSSVRSNLSVGPPFDLVVVGKDTCRLGVARRIEDTDPTFRAVSDGWSAALSRAINELPRVDHWFDEAAEDH